MSAGSGAGHLCPEHRRLDNLVKLADVTEGDERRSVPLVDRAWKAEAGIGGGGGWIAGAAGSGSPPPLERGVALGH
jgi:hypothetical protein